jgi:hypothetical protein
LPQYCDANRAVLVEKANKVEEDVVGQAVLKER